MCGELCYGRRCEDCRRACAEKGMTKQPSLYGVPPELQRWFSRPVPDVGFPAPSSSPSRFPQVGEQG